MTNLLKPRTDLGFFICLHDKIIFFFHFLLKIFSSFIYTHDEEKNSIKMAQVEGKKIDYQLNYRTHEKKLNFDFFLNKQEDEKKSNQKK